MKHKYGEIDFSDWHLPSLDNLTSLIDTGIRDVVKEIYEGAIKDDEVYISFPIVWFHSDDGSDGCGGLNVTNPLSMYINFYEDGPTFETSLNECLESYIEDCIKDGSWSDGLKLVPTELRKLADKIDAAVQTERPSHEPTE